MPPRAISSSMRYPATSQPMAKVPTAAVIARMGDGTADLVLRRQRYRWGTGCQVTIGPILVVTSPPE